jgi:enoyl-CoA hydratase/carnithine racemase
MSGTLVRLEGAGRVAEIVLASPPVNSLSLDFLAELEAAVAGIPEEARAVLVRSEVPGIFLAGADIRFLVESSIDELMPYVKRLQDVFRAVEAHPYPVVAAVDGHCLGGGLELALCCDVRIVAEGSSLGLPEVTLGIFPAAGGTQRLPKAIGQARARELLLTGRRIDAEEALRIGLANRVVPAGGAETVAREVAGELAAGAGEASAAIKRLALEALDTPIDEGLRRELEEWREVRLSVNAQEGLNAFFEKRSPAYS